MKKLFGFAIIGICLGVLSGLSQSSMMIAIVSSLLSLIVALVSLMSGVQDDNIVFGLSPKNFSVWPVAVLVAFLTIGAVAGIYMRTHRVLSPALSVNSSKEIVGVDRRDSELHETVLFNSFQSKCDELCRYEGDRLMEILETLDDSTISNLIEEGYDSKEMELFIDSICTGC
jgi:hypothetical protein